MEPLTITIALAATQAFDVVKGVGKAVAFVGEAATGGARPQGTCRMVPPLG